SAIAACSKGYAVVDPLPIPATATVGPPRPPDAGEPDASFGPPSELAETFDAGSASKDAGKHKKKTTVSPPPPRGYMVVDPLPSPPPTSSTKPGQPGTKKP
ncbi:MAG: hypothetical protein ABI551_02015, partial [Polyangiaceae bacterium]